MQISSEDLPRHLGSPLKPLYVIHGDAPLLAIEAADMLRSNAREAGYSEREVLVAEQHFKWEALREATQNLSLFASRKIIDLRIPSGKPGTEGSQALQDYAARLPVDVLTIVTLPKLDRTAQKSQWFTALAREGGVITADDVARNALPRWISGRLQRQAQSAAKDTLEFLADRCEGNLLAAFQEIRKLALLYPAGELSFEQVKDAVMDVARYDIFKLSEAMLGGNAARFAHILDGLRAEGTATPLVLWALSEDARTLGRVLRNLQLGSQPANALRDARVWGPRQELIGAAARRLRLPMVERAILHAARIDKTIKGLRSGDVWDELLQFGLRFAR